MAKTLNTYLRKLPKARRGKIRARTGELIAEELTLREIRKAQQQSQKAVAKRLKVNQPEVSKIERRADMYVSTLRSYIEAMGGSLEIVAKFPDRPPVRISHLAADE
jgi:DNA-binding XRE family transcriptional regulator